MITKKQFEEAYKIIMQYKEQIKEDLIKAREQMNKVRETWNRIESISLTVSVKELHLSNPILNALRYADIYTVDDLIKYSRRDLMRLRYIGKKRCLELENALNEYCKKHEIVDDESDPNKPGAIEDQGMVH